MHIVFTTYNTFDSKSTAYLKYFQSTSSTLKGFKAVLQVNEH